MSTAQPQILAATPRAARLVTLGLVADTSPALSWERLAQAHLEPGVVVGLGQPLCDAGRRSIDGLRAFPALSGLGGHCPSTQGALWLFVSGEDPGQALQRTRTMLARLGDTFRVDEDVTAFTFGEGRDLSGYEDGTENPKGERMAEVALRRGAPGLEGSSCVAVQRWVHDLGHFERLPVHERNHVIGRDLASNEELPDAPASAHVKRTAQESYSPPAFMLRRSMPYGDAREHGLAFIAYGASLSPFERMLERMLGMEDGVGDALFRFSRPVTGGYYFCPPLEGEKLDLRAVKAR